MPDKADRIIQRIGKLATAKATERLSAMLAENAAHYRSLSTGDVEWIRGHVFAALGQTGSIAGARTAIKEELRTSTSPVLLAGVARALAVSGETETEWHKLLIAARDRIVSQDEYIRFEYDSCCMPQRKASEEIDAALHSISAPTASCCSPSKTEEASPLVQLGATHGSEIAMQDQDGGRHILGDILNGRTMLIAFFYTRCMNPQKCSLTVTRLGALTRAPALLSGLIIAGITYDPGFDTSERLKGYGQDRGFAFSDNARLLRCTRSQAKLLSLFDAKVGFGPTTVNAHARELFLIDAERRMRRIPAEWIETPERLARELAAI